MNDFVTYNGNQYSASKLNTIKGEGAKTSVSKEQLKGFDTAPTGLVDSVIVTPFDDGFAVIIKPENKEITFPCTAYILSKMVLKKVKYDPNAKFVETEPPQQRQERAPEWNNRPRTNDRGGFRRNETQVNGSYNKTPKTAFGDRTGRAPTR